MFVKTAVASIEKIKCIIIFFADKYCELIVQEGGLCLLEELINSNTSPAPYSKILELASIVRENVNAWRDKRSQRNPANGNMIDDYEALDLDG